jgi:predicted dehydrogenase
MKALVIGFGSIGQRHAEILARLDLSVAVLSRRQIKGYQGFSDLPTAVDEWAPDYVVIASRTSEHYADLSALSSIGYRGLVLIEKPLFADLNDPPANSFSHAAVAYNLRFHPLLQRLRTFLEDQPRLIAAAIYVGQYLPHWRPHADYRSGYSAHRKEGGGVLRDLSHELDYSQWLFGPWSRLSALGGHFSNLEIDTDDVFSLILATARCPLISLHMNYLDRSPKREILVNTDRHTVRADLIKGLFEIDGSVEETVTVERNHSYLEEHRAMLSGDFKSLCSLSEGLEVLKTIEAAERAAATHVLISR